MTSAVIADTAQGNFVIQPPKKLNPGSHEVYLYAMRGDNLAKSESIKIRFIIKKSRNWIKISGIALGTLSLILISVGVLSKLKRPTISSTNKLFK